ncbi:MAG TPA: hypothetical protein VFB33_10315 [Candidatus Binataceae bacterium]|nr:hypothetical protein [Candidatus Binataceae bacterium]
MKLEDALLRVEMLRVRPEVAASPSELENATHLTAVVSALWVHWRRLVGEYGIRLLHWGNRGGAAMGDGRFLFVRLDSAHWLAQRKEPGGWQTVAGDWGLETLRAYLDTNPPHPRHIGAISEQPGGPFAPPTIAPRRHGN